MGNVSLNMDSTNVEFLNGTPSTSFLRWIYRRDIDIIRDPAYEIPYETFINDTDAVELGLVSQNDGSYWHIHYFRALPGMGYGLQIAMPLNKEAGLPLYRKSEARTWGPWCKFADGGNADTLDGRHALDFPTIVEVPDGTSANTCIGESAGGVTIYRCRASDDSSSTRGFTDIPMDIYKMSTAQGFIIAYNFNGAGIAGVNVMWAYQIFISPHYGLTWHRYIDNLTVGDWVKDDEYIGENLLDNPDFKINQRGKSEYTEDGYSLDRWYFSQYQNDVLNVVDNGIRLTSNHKESTPGVSQKLPMEKINDRYVTVSMKLGNFTTSEYSSNPGYIQFETSNHAATPINAVIHGVSQGGVFTTTLFIPSNLNIEYLNFATYWSCTMEIEWVKLEIGSNVTPFVAPNPAEELLKIQSMNDDGTPKLVSNNTLPTIMNSQMVSNPNLLINPDFKINQRGLTEYAGYRYTVDRWLLDYRTKATIVSDGIKIESIVDCPDEWWSLFQPLENITESVFTVSVYVSEISTSNDGYFYIPSINGAAASTKLKLGLNHYTYNGISSIPPQYNKPGFGLAMNGTSAGDFVKIKWMKVEVGSIPTPFCPPDPATELVKCQRYFEVIINNQSDRNIPALSEPGLAIIDNSYKVTKRVTPSVIVSSTMRLIMYTNGALSILNYPSDLTVRMGGGITDLEGYTLIIEPTDETNKSKINQADYLSIDCMNGGYIAFDAEL